MSLLTKNERDQLVGKLEQLPNINVNWFGIRAQLLNGLPGGVAGNLVVTGIPRVDLMALTDTVEKPGMQLVDNSWPILMIIENAMLLAGGLALERELRELYTLAITRGDVRRSEGAELEALLNERTGFQSVSLWAQRLFEVMRPVCRVDIDGEANGSGFLVGPSLVLTNHHVTHFQDDTAIPLARLSARFDYHRRRDGTSSPGVVYQMVDEQLPSSPFRELDFALLRLTGAPADDPVGGVAGSPKRGFLTPKNLSLTAGDPLFIIQHPQGRTMEIAFDLVSDVLATCVYYTTNTEPGSSGSPCFDKEWNVVALHHAANKPQNPTSNQAIPIGQIIARPEVHALLHDKD